MLAALATAFVAYAPAHLARGICSGSGRFTSLCGRDRQRRRRAHHRLRHLGAVRRHAHGSVRVRGRALAAGRRSWPSACRGQLATEPGPPAPWNEVTQNLGWLLVGTVFVGGAAERRPGRRQAARLRRPSTTWSRSSRTACCSPASRCSCSRPCRRRCLPRLGAARRAAATSSSSAAACGGCWCWSP